MEKWDFNSWAESYDKDVEMDEWTYRDYWNVLRLVVGCVSDLVLDISCGTGNILRFLDPESHIGV
ncbi:hypothetical protein [Pyrococcus kukulkanii]|uniref:Class I SAM-dependent methyltransferase n=1 Tax=Pyrococcus kukulkanii TaxID=1609559 RepID=A0ABV4T3M6_9EURY